MAASGTMDRQRGRRHEDDGAEALSRIESHEDLCSYRYGAIIERLGKIEKVMYWAAAGLITGMGGIILALMTKGAP